MVSLEDLLSHQTISHQPPERKCMDGLGSGFHLVIMIVSELTRHPVHHDSVHCLPSLSLKLFCFTVGKTFVTVDATRPVGVWQPGFLLYLESGKVG